MEAPPSKRKAIECGSPTATAPIPAFEKEPRFPGLIAPVPAFSADGDAIRGGVTCIFGESLWRPFAWPTPSRTDIEGWDFALSGEAQTAALLGPGAHEMGVYSLIVWPLFRDLLLRLLMADDFAVEDVLYPAFGKGDALEGCLLRVCSGLWWVMLQRGSGR